MASDREDEAQFIGFVRLLQEVLLPHDSTDRYGSLISNARIPAFWYVAKMISELTKDLGRLSRKL